MKSITKKYFIMSIALFAAFLLLTFAVLKIDVKPIGPENSSVGLAALNGTFADFIGTRLVWYHITDWLGILPIAVAFGFGVMGLWQWISRKSIKKVDKSIIVLGFYYAAVIAAYVFFELNIVNYRPVIIGSGLEASFPTSHTMIVFCIMAAAMCQLDEHVKNRAVLTVLKIICAAVIVVTVVGRLISGVHWITDIAAGMLLGGGLFSLYRGLVSLINDKENNK